MTGPGDVTDETRAFYREVLVALAAAGIDYLLGGAFAMERYTGLSRSTKDIDVFLRERDCRPALAALADRGFRTELTFPHWLGKAYRGALFVDLIYSSGNGSCAVDDLWFEHAIEATVLDVPVRLCPPEESIWQKAYVQERERFDGADVAHILRARAETLDWARLLRRFAGHWRVLYSHLILFGFIYPSERHRIPDRVMRALATRLERELARTPPTERICRGTFLSRQMYLADIEEWGYVDARVEPLGPMTLDEVDEWTAPARADAKPAG